MHETKFHIGNLASYRFLITGGAGFIGANLVEYLLKHGAGKVRVLDNFSTGFHSNLSAFAGDAAFELIEGDIRSPYTCRQAVAGMDYVSHQAALGSVPRSVNDPVSTNAVNVSGFVNMLNAVKDNGRVKRFVYASSSSVYGDNNLLPKTETCIGRPLSPYAVTKYVNELYAGVFAANYAVPCIGLRYFNVFGPKQSPKGEYAAVIPLFIKAVKALQPAVINGDGCQTRDFTFVENAVQANIKAFFADNPAAINQVYNIACGKQTSLNGLWQLLGELSQTMIPAVHREARPGDIYHSLADISKAAALLNYQPDTDLQQQLKATFDA